MKNKSKYIGPTLNLNVNKDDAELNDFLHCWEQFESRPNKIVIHNTYSSSLFIEVLNTYIVERNFFTEVLPDEESFVINDKMFVKINEYIYCSYIVIDRKHENSIVNEVTFFYKSEEDFETIQEIVEKLNACTVNFEEDESNKLSTIALSSASGLEIEPIDMSEFDIDNFSLYYAKQTGKDINKLIKEIKKSNKGLSILHGERGTGKTSVINYLASKLDRIVIFIPNNMIEHTINNPEFRKFLKRYSKPVIVIDDCEMLFHEYFTKSNMFANNLLQMVDGFLSDSMEVNIIAIFNVESEDEIDHSLLESNNLIRVIEFEYLSIDESKELSEYLGNNKQYKNKTSVLDIIRNKKPKERKSLVSKKNIYDMISELKDDEILEFLMTSEFEDDYSPAELKYLLVKWRYFYRLKQGNLERKTVDFEGKIRILEEKINGHDREKVNLQTQLADKQNIIDSMKNRNLTLKERWSGKIILKENEN